MSYEDHYIPQGIPMIIETLCGQKAHFDYASGYSYVCQGCFATIGSVGMPRDCAKLYDEEKTFNILKGK